jgi:hypothetical protein
MVYGASGVWDWDLQLHFITRYNEAQLQFQARFLTIFVVVGLNQPAHIFLFFCLPVLQVPGTALLLVPDFTMTSLGCFHSSSLYVH